MSARRRDVYHRGLSCLTTSENHYQWQVQGSKSSPLLFSLVKRPQGCFKIPKSYLALGFLHGLLAAGLVVSSALPFHLCEGGGVFRLAEVDLHLSGHAGVVAIAGLLGVVFGSRGARQLALIVGLIFSLLFSLVLSLVLSLFLSLFLSLGLSLVLSLALSLVLSFVLRLKINGFIK